MTAVPPEFVPELKQSLGYVEPPVTRNKGVLAMLTEGVISPNEARDHSGPMGFADFGLRICDLLREGKISINSARFLLKLPPVAEGDALARPIARYPNGILPCKDHSAHCRPDGGCLRCNAAAGEACREGR